MLWHPSRAASGVTYMVLHPIPWWARTLNSGSHAHGVKRMSILGADVVVLTRAIIKIAHCHSERSEESKMPAVARSQHPRFFASLRMTSARLYSTDRKS